MSGTYLGDCTDDDDEAYAHTLRAAIALGVNLVDTASNYRCQRSERIVGRTLDALFGSGEARRDELIVCTKGGYLAFDGAPPPSREAYEAWREATLFAPGIVTQDELVRGGHSIAPSFLAHQLAQSRANLRLQTDRRVLPPQSGGATARRGPRAVSRPAACGVHIPRGGGGARGDRELRLRDVARPPRGAGAPTASHPRRAGRRRARDRGHEPSLPRRAAAGEPRDARGRARADPAARPQAGHAARSRGRARDRRRRERAAHAGATRDRASGRGARALSGMRDGCAARASIRDVAPRRRLSARRNAARRAPGGEPRRVAADAPEHARPSPTLLDDDQRLDLREPGRSPRCDARSYRRRRPPRGPIAIPPGSCSPRTQVETARSAPVEPA